LPIGLQRDALVLDAFPARAFNPKNILGPISSVSSSRFRAASTLATPIDAWRNGQRLAGVVPAGQVRGEVPKVTENESVDRVGSLMGDLDTIAWRKSDSSSQYEKMDVDCK
jgi:hypothetical protein